MRKHLFDQPYLFLLPFLFLYGFIILCFQADVPFGDEPRYLGFARNLIQGFYSPPPPDINLWNGPGFPIYLVPFLLAGIPLLGIKLANGILYYLALVFLYQSLRHFLDKRKAAIAIAVTGLYYMPLKSLPHILSEPFSILLLALIVKLSVAWFGRSENKRRMTIVLLIFFLAWLALTKVIFGPVYLLVALLFLILFGMTRKAVYSQFCLILLASLTLCLPYLAYTYSITGRIFYWSNAGGMSLYWMSSPAPGEFGEWYDDSLDSPAMDPAAKASVQSFHASDFESIENEAGVSRDDRFKAMACRNISAHPGKFLLNWVANWSRMLFNYPVGYRNAGAGTLGNMAANIPVLVLLIFSGIITWKQRKHLPPVFTFLLTLAGVYLFASSFFSAYDRMFYILMPFFSLWIAWSLEHYRQGQPA